MNKSQTNHLNRINDDIRRELSAKYVKGVEEYKTDLSTDYSLLELVENAYEEAIDQIVYLHTLREKLRNESTTRS